MIDMLEGVCLKLKGTTQDIKWEQLCFLVAEKIYCMAALEPPYRVCFKVPKEEFDELVSRPGIAQAPYMARNQWVMVSGQEALKQQEWEHYLGRSYRLVLDKLSKKVQKEILGEDADFS